MNDLIAGDPSGSLPDLSEIPTETLRQELANAIGLTAKTLARLASIWAELEARGEDLSALRGGGLFSYLPQIAAGTLAPEVVVRCAGQATLIKHLSALPITAQHRALDNGVSIASLTAEGGIVETTKSLEALSIADIRKAFSGTEIRPVAQQIALIAPAARRRAPTTRGIIVKIRLTQEEYEALRREAARLGVHSPTLAREKLLAGLPVDG